MNLKFKKEDTYYGFRILEQPPCKRTIYINKKYVSLPFPYLYFSLRYVIRNKKYVYQGIWGLGLQIYCSKVPINSINDQVFILPIENQRQGLVCTDHTWDGKEFDSYEKLEKAIIGLWWQSDHSLGYNPTDSLSNNQQQLISHWSKIDFEKLQLKQCFSLGYDKEPIKGIKNLIKNKLEYVNLWTHNKHIMPNIRIKKSKI